MALMKNCCFCISPRNGAIAIAAVYLTVNVIVLILAGVIIFTPNASDSLNYSAFLVAFITSCIYFPFCVVLLIGAIKGIPVLMLLWIIVEFLRELLLCSFIALLCYSEVPPFAAYIVFGPIIVVSFYFWLCVVSARKHVIEESRGRNCEIPKA